MQKVCVKLRIFRYPQAFRAVNFSKCVKMPPRRYLKVSRPRSSLACRLGWSSTISRLPLRIPASTCLPASAEVARCKPRVGGLRRGKYFFTLSGASPRRLQVRSCSGVGREAAHVVVDFFRSARPVYAAVGLENFGRRRGGGVLHSTGPVGWGAGRHNDMLHGVHRKFGPESAIRRS